MLAWLLLKLYAKQFYIIFEFRHSRFSNRYIEMIAVNAFVRSELFMKSQCSPKNFSPLMAIYLFPKPRG